MKIIVLESLAVGEDISWNQLNDFGDVTFCRDLKQEDVKELIKDADIIIPNKLKIDASVLAGSSVKLICEAATGYNNIDIRYCHEHGITVTNVSGYSTNSVAQHTFALLLSLYENIEYYNHFVKKGNYSASNSFSHFGRTFYEIAGKRFGIVGLGAIGRQVAAIASAFGSEVVYYSSSNHTYNLPYKKLDFDTFLTTCDIITVHCPLTPATTHLFNAESFKKMKFSAYLVNVARGPVVDEEALVTALNNNEIAGAALDVFAEEPLPANSPLLTITENGRLLLTPHNAWGSVEARTTLVEEVCKNIEAYLNNEPRNVI